MTYGRSEPLSQVEIEGEIVRLLDLLEEETEACETLAVEASKRESIYKGNWAKEFLGAKGPVKEREAWADYKLADEHMNWKGADAVLRSKRDKLTSIRAALDALRTLAANVRYSVGPQ